jgi:hypothetical protein
MLGSVFPIQVPLAQTYVNSPLQLVVIRSNLQLLDVTVGSECSIVQTADIAPTPHVSVFVRLFVNGKVNGLSAVLYFSSIPFNSYETYHFMMARWALRSL